MTEYLSNSNYTVHKINDFAEITTPRQKKQQNLQEDTGLSANRILGKDSGLELDKG